MNSFAVITLEVEKVLESVTRTYSLHLPVGAPFTEAIEAVNDLLQGLISMQETAQAQAQPAAPVAPATPVEGGLVWQMA